MARVEEAPFYRATVRVRRPIRKVEALNEATALKVDGSAISAEINDIHEVLVMRY